MIIWPPDTQTVARDDPDLDVYEPDAGADSGEGELGGGGARHEGRRQRRGGGEAVQRG